MHSVYVLMSLKENKFYVGYTENIEQRVSEHNSGKNVSTQNRRPLKLLYYESHLSKQDALKRERYFKTSQGKTTLKQVLSNSLHQHFSG